MKKIIFTILICGIISGCAIGPNYKRPAIDVPRTYRGQGSETNTSGSLGEEKWWQVFEDKDLQELIRTALQENYDVKVAAERVLEARSELQIATSYELPNIDAQAQINPERVAKFRSTSPYTTTLKRIGAGFQWDLDFWGKYRRMIEQARANLLESEWAQKEVQATLITDLAAAYFQLRELDMELAISKQTLASRQDSLKLIQTLAEHGSLSMLDVHQAEELVYSVAAAIPDIERRIGQQENFISILLGKNPSSIDRQKNALEQHLPQIPLGIPSSLLERRPDIKEAEQQLVIANAQIGVARGAYFPEITLTGQGGTQSSALSDLFSGPSGMWSFVGSLAQPIFNGGRIKAGVKLAEAQELEAELIYRKTIQQAFREVSDALIAYQKTQEFRFQQEQLLKSSGEALKLSELLFKGGSVSYLQVLDSNTRYFSAQIGAAQARLNELLSLVEVYRALGGGWQE